MSTTPIQNLIAAFKALGINLQEPVSTGSQPPSTEVSADGSSIARGDNSTLSDKFGNTWNIRSDGIILRNSQADANTARVNLIVIKGGTAHQRNDDMNWWNWSNNSSWVQEQDPTGSTITSPPPTQTGGSPGTWLDRNTGRMAYKLLLPDGYDASKPWPMLVYFHQLDMGTGGAVGTLQQWMDNWFNTTAFRKKHNIIVVAPLLDQSADQSGNTVNFGGVSASNTDGRDRAMEVIESVLTNYTVDTDHIAISGNSMGGIASWEFMAWHPEMFCAALILAGASYSRDANTVAQALKAKPLWVVHGRNDNNVPLAWDRQMSSLMQKLGNPNFKYEETDEGHDVWDRVYTDPQYLDWLLGQSLS